MHDHELLTAIIKSLGPILRGTAALVRAFRGKK